MLVFQKFIEGPSYPVIKAHASIGLEGKMNETEKA
jgi:hypothetical protein